MSADRLSSEELRSLIARAAPILIEVVSGPEGSCLVINSTRVAGPKPWGGGTFKHRWSVGPSALLDAARLPSLAAEVLESRDALVEKDEEIAKLREPRWFPLQLDYQRRNEPPIKPQFTRIPWSVAEKAYAAYARQFGHSQSIERMAQRCGFSNGEMDMFHPTWREESDEIELLRAEAKTLRARVAELEKSR